MMLKMRGLLAAIAIAAAAAVSANAVASGARESGKPAFTIDSDAAEAMARREGCLKCHGVTKDKEGPSFMKLAARLKDKPDVEAYVLDHLRTGPVVKFSDGEEEDHRILKSKDEAAVTNLIRWILTR
jgi:cytochrome c